MGELERLGAALREAETVGIEWQVDETQPNAKHLVKPEMRRTIIDPPAAAAIRLLVLTGARLCEILNLQWSNVDLGAGVLRLADHKTSRGGTRKKLIVLSAPAAAVITNIPLASGNPYVIAGSSPSAPCTDLKRPWAMIRRQAGLDKPKGELAPVRINDLRHSHASIGASSGLSLPLIGKLLGHTQPGTTQRYAHLADDPVRHAAEHISSQISRALNGSGTSRENILLDKVGDR
jgi:integrase